MPEVYRHPGRYAQAFRDAAIQNFLALLLRAISNRVLCHDESRDQLRTGSNPPRTVVQNYPTAAKRIHGGMGFERSLEDDLKLIDLSHEL